MTGDVEEAVLEMYPPRETSTTNMLEQLFKGVKRRTRVVGVFPNETT